MILDESMSIDVHGSACANVGKSVGKSRCYLGGMCAVVAIVLCMLCGVLCCAGCGVATGKVSDASPTCVDAQIASGSDLTESGQYVEVRLKFDAPVSADTDVSSDFTVQLNSEPIDTKTIAESVRVDNGDVVVRLQPSDAASGKDSSVYFALYQGQLSVCASDSSGALPHVLAANDGQGSSAVCARMDQRVCFTVPSGVAISVVECVPGDAASGTCAYTMCKVDQFAQLRCVTWLGLSTNGDVSRNAYGMADYNSEDMENGTLTFKHNHLFMRDTQRECATDLAQVIQNAWPDAVTATSSGDTITLTATHAVDGEVLTPVIFEGRYADE
jgi:hypothetical protein